MIFNADSGVNYLKQVAFSVIFKFSHIILTFATVPLLLEVFGVEGYGVWSVLLSVFLWANVLDLGLPGYFQTRVGKYRESRNKGLSLASEIGQAYLAIWLSSGLLLISLAILYLLFRENSLGLEWLVDISIPVFFIGLVVACISMSTNLIHGIAGGLSKSSLVSVSQFFASLCFFVWIYLFRDVEIEFVLVCYFGFLAVSNFLMSCFLYKHYPFLSPLFSLSKDLIKSFNKTGGGFMVINLAGIVLFSTDRLLIGTLLNTEAVTGYDLVFKIYSVFLMGHALVIMPLWGLYAFEYERNNFAWIKKMLLFQIVLVGVLVLVMMMLYPFTKDLLELWVGSAVVVDGLLSAAIIIFVAVILWNNIFSMFINGVGQIGIQTKAALVAAAINIPISYLLVTHFGFGADGVVWGTICALLVPAIVLPFQTLRFIN